MYLVRGKACLLVVTSTECEGKIITIGTTNAKGSMLTSFGLVAEKTEMLLQLFKIKIGTFFSFSISIDLNGKAECAGIEQKDFYTGS